MPVPAIVADNVIRLKPRGYPVTCPTFNRPHRKPAQANRVKKQSHEQWWADYDRAVRRMERGDTNRAAQTDEECWAEFAASENHARDEQA